jgi:DNA-binding PadR family transcriptional regulator
VWFDDLQICDSTGLSPGSTYSVIRQFVDAGWLEDRWETGVEEDEPRRKFYRTTADGVTGLGLIIAEYEQTQRAGESALNRLLGKRRPKEA